MIQALRYDPDRNGSLESLLEYFFLARRLFSLRALQSGQNRAVRQVVENVTLHSAQVCWRGNRTSDKGLPDIGDDRNIPFQSGPIAVRTIVRTMVPGGLQPKCWQCKIGSVSEARDDDRQSETNLRCASPTASAVSTVHMRQMPRVP